MYEIFDLHVAVRLDFGKHSAAKLKWYLEKTFQKIMILQLPYWQFYFNVVLLIGTFVLKDCKLIRHTVSSTQEAGEELS